MTNHYYTVGDERFEADAYVAAKTAAGDRRQSLVHHWEGPLGPCHSNEAADYPVLRETDLHLWVDSPIGVIGIPARRLSHEKPASELPARVVSLRVSAFASGDGVQTMCVGYDDGSSSSYSGACFFADQLARDVQ